MKRLPYIFTGLVILSLLCYIGSCSYRFGRETFIGGDSNILKNAAFQGGADIAQKYKNSPDNKIVKLPQNPAADITSYALKQVAPSYILLIKNIKGGFSYKCSVWVGSNSPIDDNVLHFKLTDDNTCSQDSQLNVKYCISDQKTLPFESGSLKWYKYDFILTIPNNYNDNLFIFIGCKGAPKYITALNLSVYLPDDDEFKYTRGLQVFLSASNKDSYGGSGSTWFDLSNNYNKFNWDKKPDWNMEGYFKTNSNTLMGPPGGAFNIDQNQEFTVVVHSRVPKTDASIVDLIPVTSVEIPGNQGSAITLNIPNSYGPLGVNIAGKEFKTDQNVIPQNNNVYFLTFKKGHAEIWINKYRAKTAKLDNTIYFNNNGITINKTRNWNTNLYNFLIYNVALDESTISGVYDFLTCDKRAKSGTKCVYKPVNALSPVTIPTRADKVLPPGMENITTKSKSLTPAPSQTPAKSMNQPGLKKLTKPNGGTKCLKHGTDNCSCVCPVAMFKNGEYSVYIPKNSKYVGKLGWGEKSYGRNKDNAKKMYQLNFPDCALPDVLKHYRPSHKDCPFVMDKYNPCSSYACRNVDWSKDNKLNKKCKKHVSHYCEVYAGMDPMCACWEEDNRMKPECQRFRRKYDTLDEYDINVFNIEEHPDMDKYVRKDKIPCWGCNLTEKTCPASGK